MACSFYTQHNFVLAKVCLYEHLSKQIKHFLHQLSDKVKKKRLTAIITFEPNYSNCDLRIAMRDEGAKTDIDNEPPPIPSLKQ